MRKHALPADCHDAESAAQLLGLSKKALLKMLRSRGWVQTGGAAHNQPRAMYVQQGWLTTQVRSYALKGRKEIVKTYSVLLITQAGMAILQNAGTQTDAATNEEPAPAKPKLSAPEPEAPQATASPEAIEAEHRKAMQKLRELGLAN